MVASQIILLFPTSSKGVAKMPRNFAKIICKECLGVGTRI